MRVLDYALEGKKDAVSYDECGNLYLDRLKGGYLVEDAGIPCVDLGDGVLFISKEDCEKYNQYEIINEDSVEYDTIARRPYYRMRGKPVTEEQAFDIIRRTDEFFHDISKIVNHDDFVGDMNFRNFLIEKNHYPTGYGWIHVDGTVGTNGITDKYPTLMEYIAEWLNKLLSFPYLDLMVAVSYWDVMPYEVLESGYNSPLWDQHLYEYEDWDERFYESVEIGICVHDKVIEILSPAKAVAKYKEYAALYEKNREIYVPDYYMEHGIEQVNLTYLKRCIESYGLDADKELSKVREYIWKGRK